ncbi:MAG: DNA polymerase III subunit gamma/tau [Chloroflexota bacterium]|nr:DNA polymerase III subunit gamma/tau [Chloroflexota bacterium]
MTTQVYYRKWRPLSFSQVVGQEHVTTTLRQSTKQGRVSHSYLFCGPRGSGKTTSARILAKAVNCLDLQDGDPCNACTICESINDGRFMDIIELDAASNRGIDEIRDIREKVNFSPVQGSKKVYIIDEAHMLTDAASNAFLKTLEEPPGHVIFILCTTEAQKILGTIVSRCQRYDFRRIPSDLINQRLEEISQEEGVAADPDALRLVSRYSAGSLRDAENLLEQLAVSYSDGVGIKQVEDLLGLGHSERWLDLVTSLLTGDSSGALGVINQAAWDGTDLRQLHRQTMELMRSAMLLQWGSGGPSGPETPVDLPEETLTQMTQLVNQAPGWRIIRALKLWGEVNMRYDAPSTLPLELAAVEICDHEAATASAPPAQAQPSPSPATAAPRQAPNRQSPASARTPETRPPSRAPAAPPAQPDVRPMPSQNRPASPPASAPEPGSVAANWAATIKTLGRHKGKKYNLGALMRDCRPDDITIDGDTLVLAFAHRAHMERMQEELSDSRGKQQVDSVVSENFGGTYTLRLTLLEDKGENSNGPGSPQSSPLVRVALGMGARIIEEVVE